MTSYMNQSGHPTGGTKQKQPAGIGGIKMDESKREEPMSKQQQHQQHHYPTARESLVPSVQLSQGTRMPLLGMGLWQVPREITAQLVYDAIKECGVRHLDLAAAYGNEKEVGEGLKRVISEGIVTRSELFITSKLWNTYHRHVNEAMERTLSDLQLTYVDLYLVHFPIALEFVPFHEQYPPNGWTRGPGHKMQLDEKVSIRDVWMKMEGLLESHKTCEIGVSNFNVALLREILAFAKHPPAVLQVELHPYLSQPNLLRFCWEHNIHVCAYSPLGGSAYIQHELVSEEKLAKANLLDDPVIQDIAKELNKTPRQVVLKWGLQRGTGVIFKSCQLKHIEENIDVADSHEFQLSDSQMKRIAGLNRNLRFNDPVEFGKRLFHCWFSLFD